MIYIKRVTMEGFLNRRERTVYGDFGKGLNVIALDEQSSIEHVVPRAIHFVLTREYMFLNREERKLFVYKGFGPKITKAYVEILFTNFDNQREIETTMARVIGPDLDQYFLNRKEVDRKDIEYFLFHASIYPDAFGFMGKKIERIINMPNIYRHQAMIDMFGPYLKNEIRGLSEILRRCNINMWRAKERRIIFHARINDSQIDITKIIEHQHCKQVRQIISSNLHKKNLQNVGMKMEDELQIEEEDCIETSERMKLYEKFSVEILSKKLRDFKGLSVKQKDLNQNESLQLPCYTKNKLELNTTLQEIKKGHESIEILDLFKENLPMNMQRMLDDLYRISSYFFRKMVPKGKIMWIKKRDSKDFSIKASFDVSNTQLLEVDQLTESQKALIKLTFILAIMRYNTGPFCYLDQIDENIDSQYEQAMVNLIQGESRYTQFILTTHNPKLIEQTNVFISNIR